MRTGTAAGTADTELKASAVRSALQSLGVPLPQSGEDRSNFEFLMDYCPQSLAEVVISVDRTPHERRYLWCNAFRIIVPQSCASFKEKKTYFERNFKLWAEVIRFSEELYLPADENETWTEHQLSSMALCISNLIDRGESLPVLLATMLTIRNQDFSKRSWRLIENREEIAALADMIEDAMPLVPELMARQDASLETIEMLLLGPTALMTGKL